MSPARIHRSSRALVLALVLILAFASFTQAAKSADDFVHGGSSKYIQGRLQEASIDVEEGLRRYPNDSRLKALSAQLKAMKDQNKKDQGGQDSQGGDQNQDKQDQKDSTGQGKQDGQRDQQDKEQQDKDKQKAEEEAKEKEKQKEKEAQEQQDQKPKPEEGKEGDSSGQAAAPAKPGQMSKEEAERLLNSYQDDEKREQKNMQKRNRKPVDVEEDW